MAAHEYTLTIDGPELAKQRLLLCRAITLANDTDDRELAEALEGIQALLDEVADQGHDNYGLATLNDEGEGEF